MTTVAGEWLFYIQRPPRQAQAQELFQRIYQVKQRPRFLPSASNAVPVSLARNQLYQKHDFALKLRLTQEFKIEEYLFN
jgi:hypothetical protein